MLTKNLDIFSGSSIAHLLMLVPNGSGANDIYSDSRSLREKSNFICSKLRSDPEILGILVLSEVPRLGTTPNSP